MASIWGAHHLSPLIHEGINKLDGRTRSKGRNRRFGSLSSRVKHKKELSSLAGARCLPTAQPVLPNPSFYCPGVDRKECSSGLSVPHPVIEETVTGSLCWAALLPAAAGLAWLQASLRPDTPQHGNFLPPLPGCLQLALKQRTE